MTNEEIMNEIKKYGEWLHHTEYGDEKRLKKIAKMLEAKDAEWREKIPNPICCEFCGKEVDESWGGGDGYVCCSCKKGECLFAHSWRDVGRNEVINEIKKNLTNKG